MNSELTIGSRTIGSGHPTYIIAEMSANHGQDYDQTLRILHLMKEAGADAVKVQTYTADTMTAAINQPPFLIGGGTPWDGRTLHDLYQEAFMPWDWQPKLQSIASELGLDFFSTPFDSSAVDFLEGMNVPCHKVASFELVDLPLLKKVAATGKPVIASTGMATREEIAEAVKTLKDGGCMQLALLKCTSAYPALPEEMHLRTIADLGSSFGLPIGLSDHTMGHTVPVAAVSLGACIVEKHFTLSRAMPGPDSSFSMEPDEFKAMVAAIRMTEKALGRVNYEVSENEAKNRQFRRSLFVVRDVKVGETFTSQNVRCIRPGHGLHSRHMDEVLGRKAKHDVQAGTPMSWEFVSKESVS